MLTALWLGVLIAAPMQDPPPAQPEDRVADIVVDGRRMQELTRDFSRSVVAPPPGRNVSRWHSGICVGVANLAPEAARYMADRISDIAGAIGLRPLAEGCSPNILIIWTDDAPGLATALTEERPLAFRPPYAGAAAGREALGRFKTSDRAIRWWHVSLPVNPETGAMAVRAPGEVDAPRFHVQHGRLRTHFRSELRRAFIIVDVTRTGDATLGQITDYVAMVALAQIDPEADLSAYPTILNLFSPVAVADGLTDWDQSWLTALYGAELNQRNTRAQASSVGAAMYYDDWREGVRTEEAENAENE